MNELVKFIRKHAVRGECQCGHCAESVTVDRKSNEITGVKLTDPAEAAKHQPTGHTADVIFFKVAAKENPDAETFKQLIRKNQQGEFCAVNVFDGKEHDYIELGGWLGDQGLALMFIGLGTVLGIWELLTPRMLSSGIEDDLVMKLAQRGMVALKVENVSD